MIARRLIVVLCVEIRRHRRLDKTNLYEMEGPDQPGCIKNYLFCK